MIVGGKITYVEARKAEAVESKGMEVKVDVKGVVKDGENLKVSYSYAVNYAPAEMRIEGELYAREDSASAKKILEEWEKNHSLLPAFAEEIVSAINYAGSSVGTLLSFSIGVSAPLNVPRVRVSEESKKAGKVGGKHAA